jgi:hypothetical protein
VLSLCFAASAKLTRWAYLLPAKCPYLTNISLSSFLSSPGKGKREEDEEGRRVRGGREWENSP